MSNFPSQVNIGGYNATTYGAYSNISPTVIGNCVAIGVNGYGQMVFATNQAPYGRDYANSAERTAALRRAASDSSYY
jgi:hypothetical protein